MRVRLQREIAELNPGYGAWVMATAIVSTGFAVFGQRALSDALLVATRQVVSGVAFLLWAFGTWWIPLLLTFVVWRHLVQREALGYDATWSSVVFPLGIYAVASAAYGRATDLGFMFDIGRVEVWLAQSRPAGPEGPVRLAGPATRAADDAADP